MATEPINQPLLGIDIAGRRHHPSLSTAKANALDLTAIIEKKVDAGLPRICRNSTDIRSGDQWLPVQCNLVHTMAFARDRQRHQPLSVRQLAHWRSIDANADQVQWYNDVQIVSDAGISVGASGQPAQTEKTVQWSQAQDPNSFAPSPDAGSAQIVAQALLHPAPEEARLAKAASAGRVMKGGEAVQ